MASVWLARFGGRLGFERMVVIKMILPQYSQDPRFQEMFLDEANIASKIEHQNVARILDVGEHLDNYFIVMEWVDGDSLSKVLRAAEARNEQVPTGVALRIIADAAAGLHAAHELRDRNGDHLGVVHRDVSPQNILVANNGATMIIDFGVAKARDRVSQETSAGQLKGKIRYMAPEQALGRPIDHRADIWALGSMLYELFTGQPPYDGPNEVATLHKLTSGARPRPLPASVPDVIRRVVERALGYDPDERYSTALELNLALENAMAELNEPASPAIVAHYTGELLAERKAARKRAVDTALDHARSREESARDIPAVAPVHGGASAPIHPPRATMPLHTEAPSHPSSSVGSHPSQAGVGGITGPMSLGEVPSATSSTLGSAAMEYPPPVEPLDDVTRRTRYLIAAALGVVMAIGVVGAVLIVTSAVSKHDDPTLGASPKAASSSVAPTPTVDLDLPADPPAAPTAASTVAVPATAATSVPSPTTVAVPATTTAEAPPPTAAGTVTTTSAATPSSTQAPEAPATAPHGDPVPRAPTTTTHKTSPAPSPPPPKPRPTATTAPTKDRGF